MNNSDPNEFKHTLKIRKIYEEMVVVDAWSPEDAFNRVRDMYSTMKPENGLKSVTIVSTDGRHAHTVNF